MKDVLFKKLMMTKKPAVPVWCVAHTYILSMWEVEQEDHKFQAGLSYTAKPRKLGLQCGPLTQSENNED